MTEISGEMLQIGEDLNAQRSLADHLMVRVLDSSRISPPYGEGDSESFWYANEILAETQRKIAEIEGRTAEPVLATGDGLRAYMEKEGWAEEDSALDQFRRNIGNLLAERLDGSPNGMEPLGYTMASHLLRHDCEVSGRNGFTGEPMPSGVTGFPGPMYAMFFNIEAVSMAREAFGDKFADEVQAIYDDVYKSGEAERPDEKILSPRESFENGPDALIPIENATDAHQAVGIWWAQALLKPSFDNGSDDKTNMAAAMLAGTASAIADSEVVANIGRFAREVERISRDQDVHRVSVDYDPDRTLREAAELAGIPVRGPITFPWKTSTWVENGVVSASAGYGNPAEQVWPPVEAQAEEAA